METFDTGIAPSEKHLEDWVVSNLKGFGAAMPLEYIPEDYRHPPYYELDEETIVSAFFQRIVDRQCKLPSGIADLIAYTGDAVVAVELKKGAINFDVIGQCLRYVHDLKEISYVVHCDLPNMPDEDRDTYYYPPTHEWDPTDYPRTEVYGMVVGKSYFDKNIPLVCAASNIQLVTYEYVEGEYLFYHETRDYQGMAFWQQYLDTSIGRYMRLSLQERNKRANFVAKRSKS